MGDSGWVAYPMPRQPLQVSRLSHQKVNVSHQLIVEHHRIPGRQENVTCGQNEFHSMYALLHIASRVSYKIIELSIQPPSPSILTTFIGILV